MESNESYDGPVWAAILAAAIGCAFFGLLVDAAEASKAISDDLVFYKPTGDLSGKSTVAAVAWLVTWAILQMLWLRKNLEKPKGVMVLSVALILSALVMTFPPFINLFAS